jgi:hypothetical protein
MQDAAYHEALGRDGDDLLTTGSDQYLDFDYQPYWRQRVTSAQPPSQHKKGTHRTSWQQQRPDHESRPLESNRHCSFS